MKKTMTTFLKLVFMSLFVGIMCGVVGAAFSRAVSFVTGLRGRNPFLIYLLPLGGLLIVLIYKVCRSENLGTNTIISSVLYGKNVTILLAPAIFLGTVITHLFGGSAGREGAALQLGGSIGAATGNILGLDDRDLRLSIMCGMSAVFAALFGTPVAAAVFPIEVVSVGVLQYSALVPCLTASLIASFTASRLGVVKESFSIPIVSFSYGDLFRVLLLSIMCAYLSILLCECLHRSEDLFRERLKNPYLRVAAGGLMVILLTKIVGNTDYNGAGMNIIQRAVDEGEAVHYAFFLKLLFTSVTLAAGYRGGEVVPTFFIGATFGCAVAFHLGLNPSVGAAIGMIAVFCGATNTPLASFILSIEFFGSSYFIYFAIACFVSYMLSDNFSLYKAQHLPLSKLSWSYFLPKDE